MKDFIIENIALILTSGTLFIGMVTYLLNKNFVKAREEAYKLILEAEKMFDSKTGKQKMEYVKKTIYNNLPKYAELFITEDKIEEIVQMAFDKLKDYLDDGKLNDSTK